MHAVAASRSRVRGWRREERTKPYPEEKDGTNDQIEESQH